MVCKVLISANKWFGKSRLFFFMLRTYENCKDGVVLPVGSSSDE